jgi:hypothetical protein
MIALLYAFLCGMIVTCHAFPCIEPPAKRSDYDGIKKWPGNIVPYEFDQEYTADERTVLNEGLAELTAMTNSCVRFVLRTEAHPAWVRIVNRGGYVSLVHAIV